MKLIRRIKEGVRSFMADLKAQSVAEVNFKPIDCCRPPDKPSYQVRHDGAAHPRGDGGPDAALQS